MYQQGVAVEIYKRDLVLKFSQLGVPAHVKKYKRSGKRGVVKEYSKRSERRFKLWMRNTEHVWLGGTWVSLTYPDGFPIDGRTVKKHLHIFLMRLYRMGIKYA